MIPGEVIVPAVWLGHPDGPGGVRLAVLDGESGETLDMEDAPDSGIITIGTTIGPTGHVYFAGLATCSLEIVVLAD